MSCVDADLGVAVSRLRQLVNQLRKEVATCHEETAILRGCLADTGVLNLERYQVRLHRHRFTACCLEHPVASRAKLSDVLASGQGSLCVGLYAGTAEMKAAHAVSRLVSRAAQDVLPIIKGRYPGYVFMHGGYSGQRRVLSIERLMPSGMAWESIPAMSDGRAAIAATVVQNRLYVCGIPTVSTGGWSSEHRMTTFGCFDITSGCWEQMEQMSERRSHPTLAAVRGRLYVCGGFDGAESQRSVECFDPVDGKWQSLPPMLGKRRRAIAVVVSDRLYVCGGFDSAGHLATCECLDLDECIWKPLPLMLVHRAVNIAVAICDKLYVFGSEHDHRVNSSAESYDMSLGNWENLPPMLSSRRAGAAGAALRGCLYICGGWDGRQRQSSVERFSPQLGCWEQLSPMLERRDRAAIASMAGRIYVCGGSDGNRDLDNAECFDPALNSWTPLPQMSERRSGAFAVSAPS